MYEWLDKIAKEQKHNTDIIKAICSPYTAGDLQEIVEQEGLEQYDL